MVGLDSRKPWNSPLLSLPIGNEGEICALNEVHVSIINGNRS